MWGMRSGQVDTYIKSLNAMEGARTETIFNSSEFWEGYKKARHYLDEITTQGILIFGAERDAFGTWATKLEETIWSWVDGSKVEGMSVADRLVCLNGLLVGKGLTFREVDGEIVDTDSNKWTQEGLHEKLLEKEINLSDWRQ